MQIAKLTPKPERKEFEGGSGPWPAQMEQSVEPTINPRVIPPPQVVGKLDNGKMVEEPVFPPAAMPEPTMERKMEVEKEKVASPPPAPMAPKVEKPTTTMGKMASVRPKTAPMGKPRKVKITTKNSPLNVRKSPSERSPVIGKVAKGSTHSVLEEKDSWFHIVYSKGKTTGWISKKFSQIVE